MERLVDDESRRPSVRAHLLTDQLRQVSRSFYLTMRVLPRSVRPPIGLAYLLARTTDTIADTDVLPDQRRLDALHQLQQRIIGQTSKPLDYTEFIDHQGVPAERDLLSRIEEALAVLAPGMYFGEMSIVDDDSPRSADAIAHESSRLLMLPKDDLRDLMFVDRELAYELLWRFVRTLSLRLRESNDRLLMLTVSSKF